MRARFHRLESGPPPGRCPPDRPLLGGLLLAALCLAPGAASADPQTPSTDTSNDADALRLLAAVAERDTGTLDQLAVSGPAATRALAAVARVHGLDGLPARAAAYEAGFVLSWQILEPMSGGPRALSRVSSPLEDWIAGRDTDGYGGVLGRTTWRPAGPSARFGLLELGALTADVPGHRLARAALRVADGGAALAWVHSATPWRMWVDGEPAGGGWGEPSLRTGAPVLLNLGPGAHRLLLVTDGARAAVAVRLSTVDGRPLPVEPLDGRTRPDGVSLGPLPGKPAVAPQPLVGHMPDALPAELAPRAGLAAATPGERRALGADAPAHAPLWRRIARESEGDAAHAAWRRVAGLDPLDLEAQRRADAHAWPALPRAPVEARTEPPAGFDGPLWWAFARHRLEVGRGGALIEQHHVAVHIRAAGARPPWPPADADVSACTVLRGPWIHPVACPGDAGDDPAVRPGDVAVISWRRGRRDAAATVAPPPAPFGVWSVDVEAALDAPLRIELPPKVDVVRRGDRRIWTVRAETGGGAAVSVSSMVDDAALHTALDRRLPPHRPLRVPDPEASAAALAAALRRSAALDDPLASADALLQALAESGHVADPVFARLAGARASAVPDPNDWPIPLVALGERILDPRHPEGARGSTLQGVSALRIGPDGRGEAITVPVDPPEAHTLTVNGELRVDDGALLAVTVSRTGSSPFPEPLSGAIPAGVEVLQRSPTRIMLRQSKPAPLFALPGWPDGQPAGPGRAVIDLTVRAPAGSRAPADVRLDSPVGLYARTTTPTADGWRTVRTFEWRGAGQGSAAFLSAVRDAEAQPLVIRGEP